MIQGPATSLFLHQPTVLASFGASAGALHSSPVEPVGPVVRGTGAVGTGTTVSDPKPGGGASKEGEGARPSFSGTGGVISGGNAFTAQLAGSSAAAGAPEEAEDPDGNGLTEEEDEVVKSLKERDQEVRTHEQAHQAVGGRYAGGITYEYEKGPDGGQYAVGGEVQIDVSAVPDDPEATIDKMSVVKAAALAPAEPSSQDQKVAAMADQAKAQAQAELNKKKIQEQEAQINGEAPEAEAGPEAGPEIATPQVGQSQPGDIGAPVGEPTPGETAPGERFGGRRTGFAEGNAQNNFQGNAFQGQGNGFQGNVSRGNADAADGTSAASANTPFFAQESSGTLPGVRAYQRSAAVFEAGMFV